MVGVEIRCIASVLGSRKVTNEDLYEIIGGYDAEKTRRTHKLDGMTDVQVFDWHVRQVTGIGTRYHIDPATQSTETMMRDAAELCFEKARMKPSDIDFIIAATSTPTCSIPNSNTTVADMLGVKSVPGLSIDMACAGWHYALETAQNRLLSGIDDTVLILNGESLSRFLDFTDFTTAVLFGDGAAATIVERSHRDMLPAQFYLASNFSARNIRKLAIEQYLGPEEFIGGKAYIPRDYVRMAGGPYVLRDAINSMAQAALGGLVYGSYGKRYYRNNSDFFESMTNGSLLDTGWPSMGSTVRGHLKGIKAIVPHQANQRIIEGLAKKLGDPEMEKTVSIIEDVGNMSGVTSPMALERLISGSLTQKISSGDRILFTAVGGGYTIAGFVMEYL
jgi:3-oxoacyl-[acyl-carrier-protein] synthase III